MTWILFRRGLPFCTFLDQQDAIETYWHMSRMARDSRWDLGRVRV